MQVFIFRRDLRIYDNTGLQHAAKLGAVLPVFILNPDQLLHNEYRSPAAINFMLQSLINLNHYLQKQEGRLCLLDGNLIEELEKLIVAAGEVKSITVNSDYTPFSRERDKKIAEFCKKHSIDFHEKHDILLLDQIPEAISQKFTPFYNKYQNTKVRAPQDTVIKYAQLEYGLPMDHLKKYFTKGLTHQKGSRSQALANLKRATELTDYDSMHNTLTYNTSRLSPYLKFGLISIREVYAQMRKNAGYVRQLLWRDFYYIHAMHDKNCLRAPFREVKPNFKWRTGAAAEADFKKWCQGETGHPLIDACMHQLNRTHYMHNRGRLIVADYLIKHLHLPWQWGEKYFAQQLVDYDPLINNYNWQFMSGTGPAYTPTFRVMNPDRQAKLNDPDGEYTNTFK